MGVAAFVRARLRGRRTALVGVVLATLLAWPDTAHAHTDFDSSTPDDQETVQGPLDEIIDSFTELFMNGFARRN